MIICLTKPLNLVWKILHTEKRLPPFIHAPPDTVDIVQHSTASIKPPKVTCTWLKEKRNTMIKTANSEIYTQATQHGLKIWIHL